MNRAEIIKAIDEALSSHNDQVEKIEDLFNGDNVTTPTSVDKKKCSFGLWIYSPQNCIKDLLGYEVYEKLVSYHEEWHIDYKEIYNSFYNKPQKSFLTKVLHLQENMDPVSFRMSNFYHRELIIASCKLTMTLEDCKEKIIGLEDSKFTV